ncbi:solute carrier family 35 member E4 [Pygocentrus nattereri]|uniref:Sugar phosphate transporter domain-containing protein n=1 Tax=Pygocentrus nattereri TaxID=42514 RepID=A0A3B4BWI2_PYGNA|nr:solute carrier family 35 member E4 [Pygocentrus nattereri]XP_037403293.1 solute carrier family 35 member E4 [Pygocentrus nattereri]
MIRSNDGASKREWRRARVPETLHLLSAVIVWLVTGTTISSLNKWIFAVYNFRYPLLLSALHMLTAIVVDYGLIKYWFVRRRGLDEHGLTSSAKFKVFLLSLTFCASIAFGNVGLNYVQLSFAQMIYTTTPIFTLAISSLVLGKQHHILKYTAMMPICLGASFSIMGEVQFDQTGCLFVFAATMLRGVKSIQQSILLQEEKIHSVFLLYLMAIPSFCILAVAALVLENWAGLQSPVHYDRHLWGFILLSCLGSVLYNLASCCVISLTSAVTLHILGNLNVVGNLLLSQLLFESQLSALSCAGAALTLSGMIIYQNSELIAGFLDARQARPAVASHERKTSTREAEPDSGSTSKTSSDMEPPLNQSLELSSEKCHTEEPWAELYNDLEPYLDLEPSLETSPILSPDLEPSPDASPSMYQDLEPSPPILSPDLELSPEASQKLCDNLVPCPETSPKLHNDIKLSPELYHNLETSPELHQDQETCAGNSLKLHNGLEFSLETSPELYHKSESSPEMHQDLKPCLETSPELHQDLEPCTEASVGLYRDLELLPETSPELHHELQPCPETSSEVHQDLEPCAEPSPELYNDLESLPETSPEVYHESEASPEVHQDLESCPETPPELYHDFPEASPGLYDDLRPAPETSPELHQDLEPCSETSPELLQDLELYPEASELLDDLPETSPAWYSDLELCPEPSQTCDDLKKAFPEPPELFPEPAPQADMWTEKQTHEKMD